MDGISQLARALRGNAGSHALALHTPHLRAQSAAAAGHVLALPQACQLHLSRRLPWTSVEMQGDEIVSVRRWAICASTF
jgi:hypothetical protein